MYGGVFDSGLSSLFTKPSNFTDACTNPSKTTAKLKLVECKTVCLNMREETEFLSKLKKKKIKSTITKSDPLTSVRFSTKVVKLIYTCIIFLSTNLIL